MCSWRNVIVCRELIEFTENDSQEVWKGYMYAILFFAQSIAYSCFYHQLFHIGMTTGMKVKAAVIAMVYRKVRSTLALFLTRPGEKTIVIIAAVWASAGMGKRGHLPPPLEMLWSVLCISSYSKTLMQ